MLKGKSVIELTDVKTGEVETFENDNIITDGVQAYINMMFRFGTHSISTVMWKELFGGIRLYDRTLEEEAASYMHPSVDVAKLTGYASITQKDSSNIDTMRGMLNTSETKEIENGIQIVYDFATSEANGTIACCCLTTDRGGQWVLDRYVESGQYLVQNDSSLTCAVDTQSGNVFILTYDASGSKYVKSLKEFNYNEISMRLEKKSNQYKPINEYSFECAYGDLSKTTLLNGIDSGRSVMVTNNSGKYQFYIYNVRNGELIKTIQTELKDVIYCRIYKNYIIAVLYDKNIVKIDIDNPSNISYITQDAFDGQGGRDRPIVLSNGDIWVKPIVFSPSSGEYQKVTSSDSRWSDNYDRAVDETKCVLLGSRNDGSYINLWRKPNTQMLMTINNLQQPVTKTADKTMKITYTLLYSE